MQSFVHFKKIKKMKNKVYAFSYHHLAKKTEKYTFPTCIFIMHSFMHLHRNSQIKFHTYVHAFS